MTDEFLTKGLENDRYVKAFQLVDEFQAQIAAILRQFEQRMIDVQPELFDRDHKPRIKHNTNNKKSLATHHINHDLRGATAPEDVALNVHLYWLPPTKYNRTDVKGALRAFGYKLKGVDTEIDTCVAQRTRAGEWELDIAPNPYDDNKVFYRHVSSQADIDDTMSTLVEHFDSFGAEYHG